jgi:hypothetical protein
MKSGSADLPEVPEKQGCRNGLGVIGGETTGVSRVGHECPTVPYLQVLPPFAEIRWPRPHTKTALALTKFPVITKMVATSRLSIIWHARVTET